MKQTAKHIIFVLIVFCVACSNKKNDNEKKNTLDSSEICLVSITLTNKSDIINIPFDENELQGFKNQSDSIIRSTLNKKEIEYDLIIDTLIGPKINGYYSEYFENEQLVKSIQYRFNLESPNSRYSFRLLSYEYKTEEVARKMTGKVATISCSSYFGLTKTPAYVFRYENYIFWLTTPCSLSGKTFKKLKESLLICFNGKSIDPLENHYELEETNNLKNEGISGKWKLKPIASIYEDDTTLIPDYSDVIIVFSDTLMKIDQITLPFKFIRKLKLPDIQTFFLYRELIYRDTLIINPQLSNYAGDVIYYTFYFDNSVSIIDQKYDHKLFKEQPMRNFIKMSDNEFGYIRDEKLYVLEKIK